jgi:hypothetical protein
MRTSALGKDGGGGGGDTHERDLQFFCIFPPDARHPPYFITVNTSAPRNADLALFSTDELEYGLHRHDDYRH